MQFDQKQLRDTLQKAVKVVGRRSGLPAIMCVLVEADAEGWADFTTTDFTSYFKGRVPGTAGEAWKALIPARSFLDLVKATKDTVEVLPVGDKQVRIGDGELRTMEVEDFPAIPPGPTSTWQVDGVAFRKLVERVKPAASRNEARPILTGIWFETTRRRLTATTTDSYRIHHGTLTGSFQDGKSINVEATGLAVAAAGAPTKGEVSANIGIVQLGSGHRFLHVEIAGNSWWVRCIDGDFPNYKQLGSPDLPDHFWGKITEFEELIEAVKAAAPLSNSARPVVLDCRDDGSVEVSVTASIDGSFNRVVEGIYEGKATREGFNPDYLVDALVHMGTPMYLTDGSQSTPKPAAFGTTHDYGLLMPVRIKEEGYK